ncbi:hypothetical protein ABT174_39775 [Streptomyces sparsogenes]|uniref:hypothetical protein n=1 Tax=Streptomyces sparsogenes TaxID=67365 RepID=UPI003326F3F7
MMLHGAERVRQGKTPTDLERPLLDALRTVVSEAELKQWGQTYRGLVDTQGRLAMVPERITRLPVSQGYSMADLKQDIVPLVAEALASPNVQIVDPFAAAAGRPEDPAFISAMQQTRIAVTAYARPARFGGAAAGGAGQTPETADGREPAEARATPEMFQVDLKMKSFYVERAVGDAGGGKDEIYWTASTATGAAGRPYVSQEFGSVVKGQTRTFGSPNVFFSGRTAGLVGTHISVWEADQSNDGWWNALKNALNTAVDLIDEKLDQLGLIDDVFGGLGVPLWATLAWEVAKTFIATMDIFRNYDDLSCSRFIGLDRQDLAVLSRRGETTWAFNGDGHHTLTVQWANNTVVPFPVGTLECVEHNGNSWGVPVPLGWKSITPPALASYKDQLYVAFVSEDQRVMWSRLEAGGWRKPEQVGGDHSYHAPALAAVGNKLFYAVTGRTGGVYWRTFANGTWSDVTKLGTYAASVAPSFANHNGQTWLTHVGSGDSKLYLTIHSGSGWGNWIIDNVGWLTEKPIGSASASGTCRRAVTGTDRKAYFSSSTNGTQWTTRHVKDWKTAHGPALTRHEASFWYFQRDLDDKLRYARLLDGQDDWSGLLTVPKALPQDEPAAAPHNRKLYVVYRR